MSKDSLTVLSLDSLVTVTGGSEPSSLENMTLGDVKNAVQTGGCLDAVFQRGMQYGQQGWKADNRLIQLNPMPGHVSTAQRLQEAVPACQRGAGL